MNFNKNVEPSTLSFEIHHFLSFIMVAYNGEKDGEYSLVLSYSSYLDGVDAAVSSKRAGEQHSKPLEVSHAKHPPKGVTWLPCSLYLK
jgi:hypothetical protein